MAVNAGITDLCVTNHVEYLAPDGTWSVDVHEAVARFGRLEAEVREARARWPGLNLRLGAEFEYRPEWVDSLDRLAALVPFDFVIGSLHAVDGINISGGSETSRYFDGRDQSTAYERYFETLIEMLHWGAFDVVGHIDLIKRYGHVHYGPYDPGDYEVLLTEILRLMASSGIGLEINTSGIFQAPGVPYPELAILRRARQLGVPILTIGTDSHTPAHFARGLQRGFEMAREAGWTALCVFEGRKPRWMALGPERVAR